MAINPLHNVTYIPQEHVVEHHEATREQRTEQQQKTQQKTDSPTILQNPAQAELVQQRNEPIPIQQPQEAPEAKYTDRDDEERRRRQQEEEGNDVEVAEKKTRKSLQDLQAGLEQVAEGIEQLKELKGNLSAELDERLRHISSTGGKLIEDIEQTVEEAVNTAKMAGKRIFDISVAELTNLRIGVDTHLLAATSAASKIPVPEVRDQSAKAVTLRQARAALSKHTEQVTETTNLMLESAENAIRKLLLGLENIEAGYDIVKKQSNADGFKTIEAGFRTTFAAIVELNDATSTYRQQAEQLFKQSIETVLTLDKVVGRTQLGLPEKLALALWNYPNHAEECWRNLQGHLAQVAIAVAKFGNTIETTFEQASRAVLGEGQIAVDCVNEDLGDLKDDVKQSLTPSAAKAIDQILEGAEKVEAALDELVDTGKKKHDTIKRGSTAKLPSHFNVRL
ncbi:MAG: hypothetical protein RMM17_01170 [Acidobacteriota bacterium]|nr:hypothetical protein [Blastocatellia bacterium]MDW8411279.1 hypothetical protein [Acidobacteriota bacterium]